MFDVEARTMTMDHRWGRREPTELPVRISTPAGLSGSARILNVSYSGAYLHTTLRLPLFTVVHFDPPIRHRAAGQAERLAGCVVRRDERGVGVEWVAAEADQSLRSEHRLRGDHLPITATDS
jgi:hypothetical protein